MSGSTGGKGTFKINCVIPSPESRSNRGPLPWCYPRVRERIRMILRLCHSIMATAREIGQEIVQVLGAINGKGTLSGVSPESTIALQSLVCTAHKGTFRSKGSIAGRGAIDFTPYNGPGTKGTFSVIRTIPGLGSVDIISTNERWQVRVMVPGRVTGHEPLTRTPPLIWLSAARSHV